MPPSRLRASPTDETITSNCIPGRENGGRLAVTKTAATFLTCTVVCTTLGGISTPMRARMLAKGWIVKRVWCLFAGPLRPTTSPSPISELSPIPSTVATSRISTLWSATSATTPAAASNWGHSSNPLNAIGTRNRSTNLSSRLKLEKLKTNNPQNPFHDRIRRARAFADHAFALHLDFEVAHTVGSHGVGRIQIPGPHHAPQDHRFPLVIHCNLPFGFHHQSPCRQNRDDSSGKNGAKRSGRGRLRLPSKRLRRSGRKQVGHARRL